jgi:hypothetical protein
VSFPLSVHDDAHLDAQVSKSGCNTFSEHSDACAKLDRMEDGTIHTEAHPSCSSCSRRYATYARSKTQACVVPGS